MLAIKTREDFVWSYQGAHMYEKAATVGNGLLDGYIYFRPANDFLNEGERIIRDKYYVKLSDGSEYLLGHGACSHKITIIDQGNDHGTTCVRVVGKPELGIGVSQIIRRCAIEYDDGRVAVLDEDQLKIVMAELHDEVSKSLDNLSVDVKDELRNEMASLGNEIKDTVRGELASGDASVLSQADSKVSALRSDVEASVSALSGSVDTKIAEVRTEVDTKVSGVRGEVNSLRTEMINNVSTLRTETDSKVEALRNSLEPRIVLVENSVTSLGNEMESLQRDLSGAIEDKVRMGRWTFGRYTITGRDGYNNVLFSRPSVVKGDPVFVWNEANKSLKLDCPVTNVDRILRVTALATLGVPDGFAGHIGMHLRNIAGGTQAETTIFANRGYGFGNPAPNISFSTELYIPGDFNNHPLYGAGFRIEFSTSRSEFDITVISGDINLTLITV